MKILTLAMMVFSGVTTFATTGERENIPGCGEHITQTRGTPDPTGSTTTVPEGDVSTRDL